MVLRCRALVAEGRTRLLITTGKLTGQSPLYQWMNVVGAAGFIVNGWWHGALPSAVLNVIWMMIGTIALIRLWAKGQARATPE